jgi:hypothetical protein
MEEVPILGRDDGQEEFKQFLTLYDVPAYVRRARETQGALDQVLHRCHVKREEWLKMVRVRLGLLHGLAGTWERLAPLLAGPEEIEVLRRLHGDLAPRLRAPVHPTTSMRALRRALAELRESLERFNERWRAFVPTVDLAAVNALRDGYNRYYVLEKECAVRSAHVARHGFRRLEALTTDDLLTLSPPLPVPRPKA